MNKHAYLILAHNDIKLLEVLVSLLDDERNDIYIHIDKKWRDFDASKLICKHSNLIILSERIDVRWGANTVMDAELLLFEKAFASGVYTYYHLLSGSDLPIKSQDYIHHFFAQHQGKEFISFWEEEGHYWDAKYKTARYHYGMKWERNKLPVILSIIQAKIRFWISDLLLFFLGERKYPWEIKKGSNWLSITHNCVEYILQHSQQFKKLFAHTRNSDEIFIQSLIYSSAFKDKVYSYDLSESISINRLVNWGGDTNSPEIFTIKEEDRLFKSQTLFARKFSWEKDSNIINKVKEFIKNETTRI